jgi:hypothetical protein
MTVAEIKLALMTLSTSELTDVIDATEDIRQKQLTVGQDVFVVQKIKRTAGVIVKINTTLAYTVAGKKAHVEMRGSTYVVPLVMIEAA